MSIRTQVLWAVSCIGAYMLKHAANHMGASLEVSVSGNGENWLAWLQEEGSQDIRHSLQEVLIHKAKMVAAADKSLPQYTEPTVGACKHAHAESIAPFERPKWCPDCGAMFRHVEDFGYDWDEPRYGHEWAAAHALPSWLPGLYWLKFEDGSVGEQPARRDNGGWFYGRTPVRRKVSSYYPCRPPPTYKREDSD